ncbi:MAG: TVP38/TMEM64 family protein [Gemmatimonadota bacterium]|nr:MAG: TVP38/TMEM64 family protein [Gemmatimonadota bacterium]
MRPDQVGKGAAVAKLATLAGLLLAGFLVARSTTAGEVLSAEFIQSMADSRWAPVSFVVLYTVATALAMPGFILTLAGGAVFGWFWGTVLNAVAANLGATAAFFIARRLGRNGVERLAGARLKRFDDAICDYGFQCLLVLRLIPLVPFNALNFASGLTALRWPKYAIATAVGILPGTIVYTIFADAIIAGAREASREAFLMVLISGGLLVMLTFLPAIKRRLARTSGSATPSPTA